MTLAHSKPKRNVRCELFGVLPDGRSVERYTLSNDTGMEVSIITFGGIVTALRVPDRRGRLADVTPGYDHLDGYLADRRFLGGLIGRYANRIANAEFSLDGRMHRLSRNDGQHHLHGGERGFHRVLWSARSTDGENGAAIELSYSSPEGEEGYPGRLDARVTFTLGDDQSVAVAYDATTTCATPVSLTQHSYFNLSGHDARRVGGHELTVPASLYAPADDARIPTGELLSVVRTPFDFRAPRLLSGRGVDGYDHSLVLDGSPGELRHAARLRDPLSGRTLDVLTTTPALHVFTGDLLGEGTPGKDGVAYVAQSAVALEAQNLPNAPNVPAFPSAILRPGEQYHERTVYRFCAE